MVWFMFCSCPTILVYPVLFSLVFVLSAFWLWRFLLSSSGFKAPSSAVSRLLINSAEALFVFVVVFLISWSSSWFSGFPLSAYTVHLVGEQMRRVFFLPSGEGMARGGWSGVFPFSDGLGCGKTPAGEAPVEQFLLRADLVKNRRLCCLSEWFFFPSCCCWVFLLFCFVLVVGTEWQLLSSLVLYCKIF